MKKLARIAALLLAGVLALAVLSGCGGSRFEREVEETVLKYVNETQGEGAREFKNDPELRQKAYELLGKIDPESGLIDSQKAFMLIKERLVDKSTFTYIYIFVDEEGYGIDKRLATEITPDGLASIKQEIDRMLSSNGDDSDGSLAEDMTAFGAAARTIGGKTYMAIGVTFEPTTIIS